MWHMYDGYHFWGMHLIWWTIWILLILWLLFVPLRSRRKIKDHDTPLEILKKRFASGAISRTEYEETKAILERDKDER